MSRAHEDIRPQLAIRRPDKQLRNSVSRIVSFRRTYYWVHFAGEVKTRYVDVKHTSADRRSLEAVFANLANVICVLTKRATLNAGAGEQDVRGSREAWPRA
jgi:hypothetical protein